MANVPDPEVTFHYGQPKVVNFCEEPDVYDGNIVHPDASYAKVECRQQSMVAKTAEGPRPACKEVPAAACKEVPAADCKEVQPEVASRPSILRAPAFVAFIEKELLEVNEVIRMKNLNPNDPVNIKDEQDMEDMKNPDSNSLNIASTENPIEVFL